MVALCQRARHGHEVRVLAALKVVSQSGRSIFASRRQVAGDRQGDRGAVAVGADKLSWRRNRFRGVIGGVEVTHHNVGVCTAEAEAGHARDAAARVARPLARVLDHLDVGGVEIDVLVRGGVVHRRRDGVVLECFDHLDQGGCARGGLGVADVRFRGAEQQRGGVRALLPEHGSEGGGLNRVAEDCAGAVRLDEIDRGRVDARIRVRAAQDIDLGLRVRCGQPVGVPVGVGGRALDHTVDCVAVVHRVVNALEHEEPGGLRAHDAIGIGGKRVDALGRGNHPELGEH